MKKLLKFENIFVLGLIIILSCTEQNPVQAIIDFDYTIVLTPKSCSASKTSVLKLLHTAVVTAIRSPI